MSPSFLNYIFQNNNINYSVTDPNPDSVGFTFNPGGRQNWQVGGLDVSLKITEIIILNIFNGQSLAIKSE
jgi:hypothetical protein